MTKPITEEQAVSRLKRLAKVWPQSLWLFSANGSLKVMRFGKDGEQVTLVSGGVDPNYIVDRIVGIPNDGGDW